jgi:glycosyltransferase involved in cell wall biosynthesis
VFRLPLRRRRDSKGAYFWLYGRFLFSAFCFLLRRGVWGKYDLVHVHNMPDVLVFSSLVPKLTGAKVILDLHDPMPELMMTIYGVKPNSWQINLIKRLEKWSIGFADAVVTVNQACRRIFAERSCPEAKVHVVMNAPNERVFAYRAPSSVVVSRNSGTPYVIMYHGSLVERHGLDLAVAALAKIQQSIPAARLDVYGQTTPFLQSVLAAIENPRVRDAVHYHGPKDLNYIAAAIRESDVGVIPNRRSIFTELNTPTRIFEYLSQGKPVIAPRAPGITDYFGPEDLVYFNLGDADDLARQLEFVHREPAAVAAIVERGQQIYQKHCWSSEKRRFEDLVVTLIGSKGSTIESYPDLALSADKSGR